MKGTLHLSNDAFEFTDSPMRPTGRFLSAEDRELPGGWEPKVMAVGVVRVVYTFQPPVTRAVAEQADRFTQNTDLTVSNALMFMTDDGGAPVVAACLNPGAASMTTQMEHLRCLAGDDSLADIIVGTAGAIAGPHKIGDTGAVEAALRTDGVSDEFLPPSPTVDADRVLTSRLVDALDGVPTATSWTVLTPYRSTCADLKPAREAGAETLSPHSPLSTQRSTPSEPSE